MWCALVALAACGTARVVQKTTAGGTIELEGDHNKAMEQANEQMAAHCGLSNVTVLFEGVEPIDDAAGSAASAQAAPETTRTAYRVHYQCGDGAAVTPGR